MSKKIALFHRYFHIRGGAQRKLLLICQALLDGGFDVELIVAKFDRERTFHELIPASLKIEELKYSHMSFWMFAVFLKLVRKRYDLLIASNFPANIPLIAYKMIFRKSKMVWICNEVVPLLWSNISWRLKVLFRFEKIGCYLFDQVITNSRFTASEFFNYYKIVSKTIYSGIHLSTAVNLAHVRPKIQSLKSDSYILILSRLEEHKNLVLIPRICEKFREQRVVVAGVGNLTSLVEEFARSHTNLTYVGEVTHDEKLFLYQFCSLFAFLPLNEPLGVVVMEAIAANKPVVAFAKGGPMETILPNINGFLCHSEDEYFLAISSILKGLFQVDPAHGFDYISARFSASAMQQNFLKMIHSTITITSLVYINATFY